jgi:hypothetical protein
MKFTLRELLGAVIVLPPIAYASGYFLWIGASVSLYGVNFAPYLGVASLVEPGIIYAATIVIALLAAFVIGLERLSTRPFHATRRISMTRQSLFWFLILIVASVLAQAVARGYPLLGVWSILIPAIYVPAHLVLLTSVFRRLFGLLQGSSTPREEERRVLTPATRVWQGCLVSLLCALQVYLALLFSVLGPNTAMRIIPIAIELRSEDGRPAAEALRRGAGSSSDSDARGADATIELLLLERSKDRVLGYQPERREIVEVPSAAIRRIRLPRLSHRQSEFLAALRNTSAMTTQQAASFFPVRASLMRLEVDDLVRSGEVVRARDGYFHRP